MMSLYGWQIAKNSLPRSGTRGRLRLVRPPEPDNDAITLIRRLRHRFRYSGFLFLGHHDLAAMLGRFNSEKTTTLLLTAGGILSSFLI